MIYPNGNNIVGAFIGCGLDPEGIIAMNFPSLKVAQDYIGSLDNKPHHWCLSGMCNGELVTVYEEKSGQVLKNLFE